MPLKMAKMGLAWWLSGLRIWHCHFSGLGHCCGADLIPGLGTGDFQVPQAWQKKKKKRKKEKKKERKKKKKKWLMQTPDSTKC